MRAIRWIQEDGSSAEAVLPSPGGMGVRRLALSAALVARARAGPWWHVVPVLGAIVVTAVATYLILAGAARTERVLGRNGLAILERAAGLLLVAVAVQFMMDGVGEAMPTLLRLR